MLPNRILGPRHIHPGVNTPEQYVAWHARTIADLQMAYPNMEMRSPWAYTGPMPPLGISGGKSVIRCATGCGNFPSVGTDPTWGGLACCVDCGAVYTGIVVPSEWAAIEAAIVDRPTRADRHFDPETGDTLAHVLAVNRSRGWTKGAV